MVNRIDAARADDARRICEFILSHMQADGCYLPPEALWAESAAYRAELAATLSIAGELLGEGRYIHAAARMFDRLLDERVDGMWPVGYWCAFPVYDPLPLNWREENARPHARSTALVLYSLGVHHRIGGDDRFLEPAREAMARMFTTWDFAREKESLLHLSAEAAALAVLEWEHVLPEFAEKKEPLIAWSVKTFVEAAPKDFAFFTLIRTMLLLGATGTKHLHTVIRPAIDALLAEPAWRFTHNEQDFRHLRRMDQHVDIRGNGAVVATMRLFDSAAGETVYTETPLYEYLSGWMDAMRTPEGGCYGCQHIATGQRYCLGSPPHYMQLWWILGGFF